MQDDGLLPVIASRGGEDGGEEGAQQPTPNGAAQARTSVRTLSVCQEIPACCYGQPACCEHAQPSSQFRKVLRNKSYLP